MFKKSFSELEYEDVEAIVKEQVPESLNLDYKRELPIKPNEKLDSKELCKDVSSFANTKGGYLIYGVESDKGDYPKKIVGINFDSSANISQKIEQIIKNGISKSITYRIKIIPFNDNSECIILIYVPQSLNAPHRLEADKDYRYYKRGEFEATPMQEYEIEALYEKNYKAKKEVIDHIDQAYIDLIKKYPFPTYCIIIFPPQIYENIFNIPQDDDMINKTFLSSDIFGMSGTNYYVSENNYIIEQVGITDDIIRGINKLIIYPNGVIVFLKDLMGNKKNIPYTKIAKDVQTLMHGTINLFNDKSYFGSLNITLRMNNVQEFIIPYHFDPTFHKKMSNSLFNGKIITEDIKNLENTYPFVSKEIMDNFFNYVGIKEAKFFDKHGEIIDNI